jgi:hypothetical protein
MTNILELKRTILSAPLIVAFGVVFCLSWQSALWLLREAKCGPKTARFDEVSTRARPRAGQVRVFLAATKA